YLSASLGSLCATCREYPLGDIAGLGDRVQALGRRNAEIAGWLRGIAEGFSLADTPAAPPPQLPALAPAETQSSLLTAAEWGVAVAISPEHWQAKGGQIFQTLVLDRQAHVDAFGSFIDHAAWNSAAEGLLRVIQRINQRDNLVLTDADFKEALGSILLMLGLIMLEDGSRWLSEPVDSWQDLLSLLEQGFWVLAFNKVDPEILRPLAAEIEVLASRIYDQFGIAANTRPPEFAEAHLFPIDLFPGATRDPSSGLLSIPAWSTMSGDHSAISPYFNEQVGYTSTGAHAHQIAICGLDIKNMKFGPNGIFNVIQTGYGHDPMENTYYQLVKQRFLAYLEHIPPGDTLDFVGHSMGGGMTMMLLNDPEVQTVLIERDYTINSVTTYGAVRPEDPRFNGFPPSEPTASAPALFANTEVRFYVDPEDYLAMNVGAGHLDDSGQPLPNVILIGNDNLNGPTDAHTSYDDPTKYANLPPELQSLPFEVDWHYLKNYRNPDEMADTQVDDLLEPMHDPLPPNLA
ncbi:MAG: hypothetical protein HGB28_04920, partial [Oscillochloris sp.]|nr:hypothetical protein [Oscillochloris sp.]